MPKSGVTASKSKSQLKAMFKKLADRKSESQVEEEEQAEEEAEFIKQESYNLETDVYEVWFAGSHGGVCC